jgi:3-oxoacyl-[acyl-carrier protein] reductase
MDHDSYQPLEAGWVIRTSRIERPSLSAHPIEQRRNSMDLELMGKRALVCGASKGIGRAAAARLAAEGAQVTLVARSLAGLESVAEEISAATGRPVACIAADLGTALGRAHVIATCPETDILVTNAGAPQRFAGYEGLSRDDWDGWMDAHFFSAWDLIQAYTAGMRLRRFGRVVNLTANFIKFPQVNAGHSHAARLALAGAIASLVRELVPFNVTINSVLAGLVDTEALRNALGARAQSRNVPYETVEAEVIKTCPAGRLASAREMGDLVVMLAAAQMGFVTGQNIVSDGGAYQGLF